METASNNHIKQLLLTLPSKPGIYKYLDQEGVIIYVGKAKNLRKRVTSYFQKDVGYGKTRALVRQIKNIEYIVVPSELDALLLENNLIKKLQPKYNIQLKDDKTYPWIIIKNEPFPRIFYTRKMIKDGSQYFGPYPSVVMIKTLLELFKKNFDIRACDHKLNEKNIGSSSFKTSLEYYIGNCKGCCQGEVSEEQYSERLEQVKAVLKGNTRSAIAYFNEKMRAFSEELNFEKAQELKEKINQLQKYQSKSTVVHPSIKDVDVFAIISDDAYAYINYLKVNNGAIIQGHTVEVKKKLSETDEAILAFAIIDLRNRFESASKQILTNLPAELKLEDVILTIPQRGDKKSLIDLSVSNAKHYRIDRLKNQRLTDPEQHAKRILNTIQKDLRLSQLPRHIECFDNSNFHGTNAVAACVVFKNAKPSKKDYRHFNIKTVEGSNDFASMEEVVYRRYKRLLDENESLPQLIVIDGGKGQLSSAVKSLDALNLRGKIAIIGIAKKLEEIYFPGDSLPLYIDKKSESLKVIQHLRNEAHRFGITHHRNKRSKGAIQSELLSIKGIGEKTQIELIKAFKSVNRIKQASPEEIASIIGQAKAKIVIEALKK